MSDASSIHDPIAWWARLQPEKPALIEPVRERTLTYAALDRMADGWAALLAARGAGEGARVAVLARNRAEVVALLYACGRVGAALVPLNWRLAPAELARVLDDARPALVVAEARFADARDAAAGDALAGVPWLDLDHAAAQAEAILGMAAVAPVARVPADGERAAMILYTSGSTGRPKGAIIPHRQILHNAIATTTGWQLGADDCGPVTTPLFHTGGWNVFATPLWFVGGTVVLLEAFDPDGFLDVLETYGCTVAFGVPTQLVMLAEHATWGRRLPRLRWFISGGAPCPESLKARIRAAGYRMREGFGMTEFGPNCFATSDDRALARPGTVGWPAPFVEMRLVDEAGRDVADGEVGELLLRGPQRFAGYLHDPARTAEVLTADGWLRTGDLASRDADGAFAIRGRRKDMFISGGENVYPGEVEAALAECAGVAESAVVGVPDPRWGEIGHGFVQPRQGHAIHVEALVAELRARLAHYKVPKRIDVVPELPRMGSGKIDREGLRRLAASEEQSHSQPQLQRR